MVMQPIPTKTIFDVITDFLATNPSPQEILDFKLSDELQARASDLLDRNGEDLLTYDEELEMMDFVRANDMMSLLKAKTRQKMAD
ncbi:MAG: hypothetical protein Phog2KO_31880 [Phototrophicaceae bacterium]